MVETEVNDGAITGNPETEQRESLSLQEQKIQAQKDKYSQDKADFEGIAQNLIRVCQELVKSGKNIRTLRPADSFETNEEFENYLEDIQQSGKDYKSKLGDISYEISLLMRNIDEITSVKELSEITQKMTILLGDFAQMRFDAKQFSHNLERLAVEFYDYQAKKAGFNSRKEALEVCNKLYKESQDLYQELYAVSRQNPLKKLLTRKERQQLAKRTDEVTKEYQRVSEAVKEYVIPYISEVSDGNILGKLSLDWISLAQTANRLFDYAVNQQETRQPVNVNIANKVKKEYITSELLDEKGFSNNDNRERLLQEINDPEVKALFEKALDGLVINENDGSGFPPTRYQRYAEAISSRAPALRERLNGLIDDYPGRTKGDFGKLEELLSIVTNISGNQTVLSYDQLRESFFSELAKLDGMLGKIWGLERYHENAVERLQKSVVAGVLDTGLDIYSNSLFQTISEEFSAEGIGDAESLEQVKKCLSDRLVARILESSNNSGDAMNLGVKLLEFDDPSLVSFIVVNAFRQMDSGAQLMVVKGYYGKNDSLSNYLFSLSDETTEQACSGVPGLKELIELIKFNPDTYSRDNSYIDDKAVENPVFQEVQARLKDLVLYNWEKAGYGNTKYYLTALEHLKLELGDEFYDKFLPLITKQKITKKSVFDTLSFADERIDRDARVGEIFQELLSNCHEPELVTSIFRHIAMYYSVDRTDVSEFDPESEYARKIQHKRDVISNVVENYMQQESSQNIDGVKNYITYSFHCTYGKSVTNENILNREDFLSLLTKEGIDKLNYDFRVELIEYCVQQSLLQGREQGLDRLISQAPELLDKMDTDIMYSLVHEAPNNLPKNKIMSYPLQENDYRVKLINKLATKFGGPEDLNRNRYLLRIMASLVKEIDLKEGFEEVLSPELQKWCQAQNDPIILFYASIIERDLNNTPGFSDEEYFKDKNSASLILNYDPDILEKYLTNLISQDTESVNKSNWFYLLYAYTIALNETNYALSAETKNQVIELFKSNEAKDLCLGELRELYREYLEDPTQVSPILKFVINKVQFEGAGNLRFIESLCEYITSLETIQNSHQIANTTKIKTKDFLGDLEKKFTSENWTNAEKTTFYDVSRDFIESAPSLYGDVLTLLESLDPKELQTFQHDVLPIYQAYLIMLRNYKGEDYTYNPRELVGIRHLLCDFQTQIQAGQQVDSGPIGDLIELQKQKMSQLVKQKFEGRFRLLSVSENLTQEQLYTLVMYTRYMGNINAPSQEKSMLLAFYLGLNLTGDWQKLRRQETVSPEKYFGGEQLNMLTEYLEKRAKTEFIPLENLGLSSEQMPEFQQLLQEEVISQRLANIETIDVKLARVVATLGDLVDPDLFPNQQEKEMLGLYREKAKLVNATLAKMWQKAGGKAIALRPEELEVEVKIKAIYGNENPGTEDIKKIQDANQSVSLITSTLKKIEDLETDRAVEDLKIRLSPSDRIIELFNKIGEGFEQSSGALAISSDITFLESLVNKKQDQLESGEIEEIKTYLNSISDQIKVLEETLFKVQEYFKKIKSADHGGNESVTRLLTDLESAIYQREDAQEIITHVTHDMPRIIQNIRQCLGCLTQECNNDTNLTFADPNKFLIISADSLGKGSNSDELLYLLPAEMEDGTKEMTFTLDRIYGIKSSAVLISNIKAVFEKLDKIKKRFPQARISIFVTDAALNTAGIPEDVLRSQVKSEISDKLQVEPVSNVKITKPVSPSGDYYEEFTGGYNRKSGDYSVGGYRLTLG